MFRQLSAAGALAAAVLVAASPAKAGPLTIHNVGSVADLGALGAINTAIANVESLYSAGSGSPGVTLNVNFSYSSGGGSLGSSTQYVYDYSYAAYTNALMADLSANPGNTNLATAIANLGSGNSGRTMRLTYGQALMLSNYGLATPTLVQNDIINIASDAGPWNFTGTTTSSQYDAVGVIEHELDELLGIGGGGSFIDSTYYFGATDLFRYSGIGVASTSTSGNYLSIDGGLTNLVGFNGNSGGDYGDFAPSCSPAGSQNIQNAFNCKGPDEAYTTSSPEYVALTAIGWTPTAAALAVPEPSSLALFASALFGLGMTRRLKKARQARASLTA